jgi:putative flippase GtrA
VDLAAGDFQIPFSEDLIRTMLRSALGYLIAHRLQLVRFCFVGVVTFGINFSSFHLFYGVIALDYKAAVSLAYLITVVSHFTLHRVFTFGAGDQALFHHTWKYLTMLVLNYMISLTAVWICVEVARISPYFGIVASTFGTACVSFFAMKHFVFDRRKMA